MSLLSAYRAPTRSHDRLRDAHAATAELITEIIGETCRRFPSLGQTEKTARIEQLIHSQAWTDAAFALIDLELPLWQVRRIAYDDGEWYCALSRERELPDWLDQSIEARHPDLGAGDFGRVRRRPAPSARLRAGQASPPCVVRPIAFYQPVCATISRNAPRTTRSAAGPEAAPNRGPLRVSFPSWRSFRTCRRN